MRRTISLPNLITVLRIFLTPLFVILLIRGETLWALGVFLAAGVSDGLDGLLARLLNQRSTLGAVLDPIADKLLLTAAFICLALIGGIPPWVAVVVISRDVLIVIGVAVLAFANIAFEIRPSILSKWTTVCQVVLVASALLALQLPAIAPAVSPLCWVAVALTILSGLHYTWIGLHLLQGGFANAAKKQGADPPEARGRRGPPA
ncbi:MAG: CDP-alcohol phosphatidyltransferase family protein [Desulfobacterales bacterium]